MKPPLTRGLALLVVVLMTAVTAGCGDLDGTAAGRPAAAGPSSGTSAAPTDGDPRRAEVEAMLRQRAKATLKGDRPAFLSTVGAGSGRAEQLQRFRRLADLPLATVRLELGTQDPSERDRDRYVAVMTELVQLDGFDPAPVPSRHQVHFQRTNGVWRITKDAVESGELNNAPWNFPGTSFAFGDHVAVVVDSGSAGRAEDLVAVAEEAREHDNAYLPDNIEDLGGVVMVAFSDTSGLEAQGIDTQEIGLIGGLAFPVLGDDGVRMETRALIAPAMLDQEPLALAVVARHELTHVALAEYQGPVWLTEGVAEYVAWREEPRIYISPSALHAADEGFSEMPQDLYFHRGDDWSVNYALSWFACRALAERGGTDEPLEVLEAVSKKHLDRFEELNPYLRHRDGLGVDELAAAAGDLIVDTFGHG